MCPKIPQNFSSKKGEYGTVWNQLWYYSKDVDNAEIKNPCQTTFRDYDAKIAHLNLSLQTETFLPLL